MAAVAAAVTGKGLDLRRSPHSLLGEGSGFSVLVAQNDRLPETSQIPVRLKLTPEARGEMSQIAERLSAQWKSPFVVPAVDPHALSTSL